LLRYIY